MPKSRAPFIQPAAPGSLSALRRAEKDAAARLAAGVGIPNAHFSTGRLPGPPPARELYIDAKWEMYEIPSGGIGIRHCATRRRIAVVCAGPTDLDNARMVELAPQLVAACEAAMMALGRAGANVMGGPGRAEWELCRDLANKARGLTN